MAQRIGIIDMGTNTFHLLIAELTDSTPKIIVNEKVSVGLGRGGINKGLITDEAMDRALSALRNFRTKLDEWNVQRVIATGTSAVRSASNQQVFIDRIKKETNIDVLIINGAREAELIYRGVKEAVPFYTKRFLAMDVGGGSVEFIIGDQQQIFWKQSFEIGGQRLLETYHNHDPMLPEEITAMNSYFEATLQPLKQAIADWSPEILLGSSGSFDTLAEINIAFHHQKDNLKTQTSYTLPFDDFTRIKDQLEQLNRADRLQIPGMIELRVDMIVVGVFLIDYILHMLKRSPILVSTYSLKEGVLHTLIDEEKSGKLKA